MDRAAAQINTVVIAQNCGCVVHQSHAATRTDATPSHTDENDNVVAASEAVTGSPGMRHIHHSTPKMMISETMTWMVSRISSVMGGPVRWRLAWYPSFGGVNAIPGPGPTVHLGFIGAVQKLVGAVQNARMRQVRERARFCLAMLMVVTLLGVPACRRTRNYNQSSADATVQSLADMLKDGNVQQIPSLIHAEDPKMQELLDKLGPLFARLNKLSETLQEKYPDEFNALLELAADAGSTKLTESGRTSQNRDQWRERMTLMIADPFGTLDGEMERLSTMYVDDETFALTIDGQPAFGVGVLIRQAEDGKWYFHMPDNIPGLNSKLPKTEAEWRIMNSMLKSVTNGVEWTERRIAEEENAGQLEEIWGQLAIDVGPQLVLQWGLYEQATKSREARLKKEREAQTTTPADPSGDGG